MRTPARFRTETKYVASTDRKANVNVPIMAAVGNGDGATAAVVGRNNFFWVRLLDDDDRLTQAYCQLSLSYDDLIYVAKAKDRKLTHYEFVAFIQDTDGGTAPPVCPKWAQVFTVSVNNCQYRLVSEAVTAIVALIVAGNPPSAASPWLIQVMAGDYDEGTAAVPANVTIPRYVHLRGRGESTVIDMDDYYLEFAADTSGEDFEVIGTADDSGVLVYINGSNAVLDSVRVHLEDAGCCVYFGTGIEDVELYHVICEADGGPSRGFWVYGATSVLLWDCKADDHSNFGIALDLDDTAAGGTVTTKFCEFVGTSDVTIDATYTWEHIACNVDAQRVTLTGTSTPLPITPVNLDGWANALILDADGDTTISAPTDDEIDFEVGGVDVGFLHAEGWMGETFAFPAKNTSGGAVAANDVGYTNEAGEFKTTATQYDDVAWCVVTEGGANNADIFVTRRGRVTVVLDANCAIGDFLYTSGTATQASVLSYMRPEVFAVALSANVGGAGGTCSALLYCLRVTHPASDANDLIGVAASSNTDWLSSCNGAPVGAVVTYNAPLTAGAEDCIVPLAAGQLCNFVLRNTTRGEDAYVAAVNTGANTITVTNAADVAAWLNAEVIQVRTVNFILGGVVEYLDVEVTSAVIPVLTTALLLDFRVFDAGGACTGALHPNLGPYAGGTVQGAVNGDVGQGRRLMYRGLINRRFCYAIVASGAGTTAPWLRLMGYEIAVP